MGFRSSPLNRPWPPGVQKVSDESPALSPAEALKTFYMPPGYRVELVASEPLIQDPIVMDWDLQGRLWAVEMPGFVRGSGRRPSRTWIRSASVVVLEDTNRDGVMDKRTVFADGLVLARSLKVLDRGVLVGEPPQRLADARYQRRPADGHEGARHRTSYGRREARVEQNANGFYWGARQLDAHGRQPTRSCG